MSLLGYAQPITTIAVIGRGILSTHIDIGFRPATSQGMDDLPLYALFIRGPSAPIFALSDAIGFDEEMQALAVSVFEDGPDSMHIQALFATQTEASACAQSVDLDGLEYFIQPLPDEDWVAKSQAGLPPVRTRRFFVYGSHDRDNIAEDCETPILIDAGMAFGTGHHGTTKGCLLAFEALMAEPEVSPPNSILDLGCGTGVLAIAAAKTLNRSVLASDIDPDAVEITRQNAKANQVEDLIIPILSDGLTQDYIRQAGPFDLIFANILAGPLKAMAPEIATNLAPKGHVILSGILDEQAQALKSAFKAQALNLTQERSDQGWTTLTYSKP